MVNPIETQDRLLTQSADNTTGNWTNQNEREFINTSIAYANVAGGGPAIAYAPPGHAFGRLISGSPATLATYYGSDFTAARAAFPFATSLTNYTDRCVLQLALNNCTATGGGDVLLSLASLYLDTTVTWDGSLTSLRGIRGPDGLATTFYTQTCGSSPALYFTGGSSGSLRERVPLSEVNMCANNGSILSANGANGVASTNFITGSKALQIGNASNGVAVRRVVFFNYDTPHAWITGNVYLLRFIDCEYGAGNYGPSIGTTTTSGVITNSFEAMRWIRGGAGGNNWGCVFNLPNGSGDLFLSDMSLDYNYLGHIWYDGLGAGNDAQIPLFVDRCHLETSSAVSGSTATRIFNNGNLFISNSQMSEQGTFPPGYITQAFEGRTTITGCQVAGTGLGGIYIPVVLTTGNFGHGPIGSGNADRFGGDIILARSAAGDVMSGGGYSGFYGNALQYTSGFSLSLVDQLYLHQMLSTGGNITMPPDSVANQAVGTTIRFITFDTSVWTFVATSPATITSPRTLSFGGGVGQIVELSKTAANTWFAVGAMT